MDHEQLSLPLFDHPTFDELIRHRALEGLRVTLSRRLRSTWHVTINPVTSERRLVVPAYLRDAPEEVKLALLEWATLARMRRRRGPSAATVRRRELERRIFGYCRTIMPASARGRALDPATLAAGTRGCRYDLAEVFTAVNTAYFGGALSAALRWGRPGAGMSYHTQKTGPDGTLFNLITISGAYDHPDVPRFAIEAIMHHEMCHIAVPPALHNGRRVVHGEAFREMEKRLPVLREWKDWERSCLPGIIRQQRHSLRCDRRQSQR